jgi:diphthamide biosynthesis methyltransferase
MVLYLIGLGLFDEQDITLRGLAAVRGCARVYLEAYTSILLCDKARLEALYGKEVCRSGVWAAHCLAGMAAAQHTPPAR